MVKLQLKYLFLFFQAVLGGPALPFLPTREGITVNDAVSRGLGLEDSHGVRRPRALMSVLTLLWPQVVGPMHDGIIKEPTFEDVPETPLEHHLQSIRERSKLEESTRHHIRDLLNQGPPPGVPLDAHNHLSQMQLLNQLHPNFELHQEIHPSYHRVQHALEDQHHLSHLQLLHQVPPPMNKNYNMNPLQQWHFDQVQAIRDQALHNFPGLAVNMMGNHL